MDEHNGFPCAFLYVVHPRSKDLDIAWLERIARSDVRFVRNFRWTSFSRRELLNVGRPLRDTSLERHGAPARRCGLRRTLGGCRWRFWLTAWKRRHLRDRSRV